MRFDHAVLCDTKKGLLGTERAHPLLRQAAAHCLPTVPAPSKTTLARAACKNTEHLAGAHGTEHLPARAVRSRSRARDRAACGPARTVPFGRGAARAPNSCRRARHCAGRKPCTGPRSVQSGAHVAVWAEGVARTVSFGDGPNQTCMHISTSFNIYQQYRRILPQIVKGVEIR